jgi:hypothetical protein
MNPKRPTIDERPGPAPDIRVESDSVAYTFRFGGVVGEPRLLIRCDVDGNIWISIV